MSAKEIVQAFYNSDIANDATVVPQFFHKECEMHWTSSQGFTLLTYDEILEFFKDTRKSYNNLRFEFTHFLECGNFITTRHTLFAHTIEDPESETMLAHFCAIWEIKDGKLFRCYEISHQADESDLPSVISYSK